MGHTHTEFAVSVKTRRLLAIVSGALAAMTVVGLVVLWPPGDLKSEVGDLGFTRDLYDARVESVRGAQSTSPRSSS